MRPTIDLEAIEHKWLERWHREGVYEAQRGRPGEKKFFLHFAYPGISGYLHVGHMRGFSYSDVFCRYKRMTGHRVLFPAGFHASGIPSVGLARKVERGDAATLEYLRNNGCPPEQIPRLKDPVELVRYFSQVYTDDYWRRFGFLIDWRTLCTTIDPGYMRFIQWQFQRLNDKGLLTVKPHYGPFCPVDGAVAVDASETDLSRGGNAEVQEFTLVPFALEDGTVLPCATLRPETVFGVTNLWLEEGGQYTKVNVGSETWLVSAAAADKLRALRQDVGENLVPPQPAGLFHLFSQTAKNPMTGQAVPILPATFVTGARGTGVVMSVPAHAPYDYQALVDVRPDIQPILIIQNPKVKGVPAAEAVKALGVKSQRDRALLDQATEQVYKDEFHGGVMLPHCGFVAGLKVSEAKEKVKDRLKSAGTFQDFSEEVVCRCGRNVILKRIPDQWFIRYSDEALTRESQAHARTMKVYPEEYQRDLPDVLDWFGDRACIRKGSWLGTEFPLKPGWIVEPISDSTFYPAFYIIQPYLTSRRLKVEDLSDAFFDYVFQGKGAAASPTWEEVRKDFDFWYPVDINLGGKEHKTVHFPPYIMNHVALVGPDKRPRGIFVNWWVTQKAGEKISKSKGGAEPIPNAAKKYSVDGMRLYYANASSPHVDLEWDPETVLDARQRVTRLLSFVDELLETPTAPSPPGVDDWLQEAWNARLSSAAAAFEAFDLRTASNQLYYEFYNDLVWWRRRGGQRNDAALNILKAWSLTLAPITPFLAEEMGEHLGNRRLASTSVFPTPSPSVSVTARIKEDYLRAVLEDLNQIVRVTQIKPRRVVVHTSPAWKVRVVQEARQAAAKGERNPGEIIKRLLADPEMKAFAKDLPGFVQKALKEATGGGADGIGGDEFDTLAAARSFLSQELGADVEVYRADDASAPDPGKKRNVASPRKPAIYVE